MQPTLSAPRGQHPVQHSNCYDPVYAAPPPEEEPPPSYDAATYSPTSPLLVGPPPDYGAIRAYLDPDESSEASSEVDETEQYFPERLGQAFSVLMLVGILCIFWSIINQPDPDNSMHSYM
ncbi:hypothetical protein C7974DRAFT_148015 [Boeremia exigua]|uniref:uncharacterized protein n=1 Tax=Boeremia exigua TaxID=749465 RepID=UPI001E8CEF6C|nr:uncharacterized protein C7974DRAFT_148015 [Boeremia exigua]KAH6637764.1 hypothetical protein C7974DRAFT_148015 [Boeremia exigua]